MGSEKTEVKTDLKLSILLTIKKLLGLEEEETGFDPDIIVGINSALFNLRELGLEPDEGGIFTISDETTTWGELLDNRNDLELVKTFIYLKVRLTFDPPQNSFLVEAIKSQINEMEWRLNVKAEGDSYNE